MPAHYGISPDPTYDKRRLQVRVGIGYGDDIGRAKQVILDAMRGAEGILGAPPPFVLAAELGDFAVQLDVFFWIDPPKRSEALDAVDDMLSRIKPTLQKAGVDLPYPTTQVLLHDQTEASDGDRAHQREGWPARGEDPRPRWRILLDEGRRNAERPPDGVDGDEAGKPDGPRR